MYCPRCKRIIDENKCPDCKKPTREPKPDDICLLCEKQQALAEMLSDVLEQNGIQSLKMGTLGAGLSALLGANIEYTKVYTTYEDRERAMELTDELFGGAAEDFDLAQEEYDTSLPNDEDGDSEE